MLGSRATWMSHLVCNIRHNKKKAMAEESGGASWWGGWGNEILQSIKEKSSETIAMVKQDLSEFMTTVHEDTTSVIADTATAVKDQLQVNEEDQDSTSGKLKQGMSDWFGTISSTLKDNLSQVANTATASFAEADGPVFDRFQARLNEIQTDPTTYCSEPDGHPHLYKEWCERFDLEQCKGEISELLVNKPKVRALYTNLVPSAVSHSLFWQRYFYKVHQLNQEEKKRAALVERANKVAEEDLGWGDEEDDLWGSDENSLDNLEPTLTNQESSRKVASDIGDNRWEGQKMQPGVSGKAIGHDSGDKLSEIGDDGEGTTATSQSIVDTPANRPEGQSDGFLEEKTQKDAHDSATEKTLNLQQSNKEHASANILTLSSEGDSFKVLPERCDSAKLEIQPEPSQEVGSKKSSTFPESSSTSEGAAPDLASEGSVDPPALENPAAELSVHSQLCGQQQTSPTGSGDSSWSKLSEEANGTNAKPSLSKSSSSSSGVLVPSVGDKDIDWDNDLDLDEDISEEEMKKIMESLGNSDLGKLGDLEVDDDWDSWE